MRMTLHCAAIFILTMSLASAQGAPAASKIVPKAAPRTPAKPRLSDAQIEAAIKAKFGKSKINANHFQVHVQGGVATLEGRTDILQHKGTATRLAKNAGATAVNNRIQVSDAARKRASDNLEKGRRRVQVKRSEPRK